MMMRVRYISTHTAGINSEKVSNDDLPAKKKEMHLVFDLIWYVYNTVDEK